MSERPQFCQGCEYLPEGVVAEVTDADVVTMSQLKRYRYAYTPIGREVAEEMAGLVLVCATVTNSTNPKADVGDEASMLVKPEGRSPQEIVAAFGSCPGPQKNFIDRVLNRRGTCPAAKRA